MGYHDSILQIYCQEEEKGQYTKQYTQYNPIENAIYLYWFIKS